MSIDVEDSIKGFVKTLGRNEILPFLGIYQRLVYSYVFFKKLIKTYNPDFVLVTGGLTVIPNSMAAKTIVYVTFSFGLGNIAKRVYFKNYEKKNYEKIIHTTASFHF